MIPKVLINPVSAGGAACLVLLLGACGGKPESARKTEPADTEESGAAGSKNSRVESHQKPQPAPEPPRTWTASDGRKIEGVIVGANGESVQLRVLPAQIVHNLPIERLSADDRAWIGDWIQGNPEQAPVQLRRNVWPTAWDGAESVPVRPGGGGSRGGGLAWHTSRYELRSEGGIDPSLIGTIAAVCESVEGATGSLPLPLHWGREGKGGRRHVVVVSDGFEDMPKGLAGYFNPESGDVHLDIRALFESDMEGYFRQFHLSKRQEYDVVVHELTHQVMAGILLSDIQAWVGEGLAEYMSAMQRLPGRYRFRDTHVAVRQHINKKHFYEGVVNWHTLRLKNLEGFMDRRLNEWNQTIARNRMAGEIQYVEALIVVDYFCHVDSGNGAQFRQYLEAVLTGAPEEEARRRHLLRGRSYSELEAGIANYWKPKGFQIFFQPTAEVRRKDFELGVGIRPAFSRPGR